jgi:hypothetical protein
MTTSRRDQLRQQRRAEPIDEPRTGRSASFDPEVQRAPRRLRSRPIRVVVEEAEHVYELERAGESEWTPWIALVGLIVFYAVLGLLMFGIIEVGSHLMASVASPL